MLGGAHTAASRADFCNLLELAPFLKDFEDPSILKKLGAVFLGASEKRVQSLFHDVVAAPDRPVSILIVGRGP